MHYYKKDSSRRDVTMSSMTANLKRVGAAALAATFIIGQFPLSAMASGVSVRARTADTDIGTESVTITEFASLSDSIKTQKLYVGESETKISFPDALTATVIVPTEKKDEPAIDDKDGQETTDDATDTVNDAGESTAPENPSQSDAEQTDTPSGDAVGTESGGQSEPAAEGGSDSASIANIIGSFMIPSTVYAQEGSETTPETKEITIEGISWKIDASASSKDVFSSAKAGLSFVYVAVLPDGYIAKADLPTIKVTIEKKNEDYVPSRNEYGTVEYLDDKGLSYSIDDYAAVLDSSRDVTWKDDWYVVGEDVEITGQINVDGNVNIVLTDGHTLKITDARVVVDDEDEAVINIFGQTEGTGKLTLAYKVEDDDKDDDDEEEDPAVIFSDGDFTINGGVIEISSGKGTAVSADCVVINAGTVKVTGKTGIITKDKLTVLGGQSEFSSIGSEKEKSGDVVLDYDDEESYVQIAGGIFLKEAGTVSIVADKALTDGAVAYEGVYTSTSDPAYTVLENKKLVHAVFEETPKATFTASGTQSAKLKGLVKEAEYEISGAGFEKTLITAGTDGTYKIASGIKVGTFEIVKKRTGAVENGVDSKPQTFTITKAENPSKLTAKACTTAENNDGKITGLDSSKKYEYRALSDTVYTAVSTNATQITGLKNGTYYVRLRPVGTMLASASLKVEIGAYTAKKAIVPSFSKKSGTYTGAQTVTLTTSTAGAKIYYTVDGTTPTADSTLYTGPISVAKNTTIKAITVKEGMIDSAVASATYYINTETKRTSTTGSTTTRKTTTTSRTTGTTTSRTTGTTTKTTGTTSSSTGTTSRSSSSKSNKSSSTGYGRSSVSESTSSNYDSDSSFSTASESGSSRGKTHATPSRTSGEGDANVENEYPAGEDDLSDYIAEESEASNSLGIDPASLYAIPNVTSNESEMYYSDGDMDDFEVNDIYNEGVFDLYDIGYGIGGLELPMLIAIFASVAGFAAVVAVCLKNKKSVSVK